MIQYKLIIKKEKTNQEIISIWYQNFTKNNRKFNKKRWKIRIQIWNI